MRIETLGAERWKALDTAAKYAAISAGHTRAQLFARAMAGLVSAEELLERMQASRHQDSVRALGLLPLAEGEARAADLLQRYKRLQEFHREARKFGSQRQQSERRAVAIGLSNLARTAGFRDPQRLQWAMEQAAVADLARGPVVLERDGVSLTLAIDEDGVASLSVAKGGKPLKSIPASLKKDVEVEELKDRLQELKRQRSRVRDALEEAMCRGDRFSAGELRSLFEHPVLAPAVARLVFVGEGQAGYPAEGGRVLRDHAGASHIIGNDEELRVAHPHDLFVRGDWSQWQRECFAAERVQPFKQVFRELYPLTDGERGTTRTARYAGHQVNPRQALALLGSRGWVSRPDEGVSRTFHEDGLTVRLSILEAFSTPAEIEGVTHRRRCVHAEGRMERASARRHPTATVERGTAGRRPGGERCASRRRRSRGDCVDGGDACRARQGDELAPGSRERGGRLESRRRARHTRHVFGAPGQRRRDAHAGHGDPDRAGALAAPGSVVPPVRR